jgi:uncharacterized damage-inducible protein DinB
MSQAALSPEATPDPRFPVGRFERPPAGEPIPESDLVYAVSVLAELPEQLRNAVDSLDEEQLATPYREGGWTVRQLVHHIADSHMNAFVRVRLALTEDAPAIKPYAQDAWANLHDATAAPIEWSLELTESLHARWVMMLQSLTPAQWTRTFIHPENGAQTIAFATLLYAWHCRHHLAHITHLRAAKGW